MRQALASILLTACCITPARGDMTLFFKEVSSGVEMRLRGSINTAGLGLPGDATSTGSSYTHSQFQISGSGGAQGSGISTSVKSRTLAGDLYLFSGTGALTKIGIFPPLRRGSSTLNVPPPFWFGFDDTSQSAGPSGAIKDSVYLPDGYVSNSFIKLDHLISNRTLQNFDLVRGDRWGVSFSSGSGTQSMIFHVVPEPSSILLLTLSAVFALRRPTCWPGRA